MTRDDFESDGADATRRQFVTFRVQAKRYGVPIESVAEMTQLQDTYPISGAPGWILGMMQLRDSVVPILDLRLRLGFSCLQDELESLNRDLSTHRDEHVEWIRTLAADPDCRDAIEYEKELRACGLRSWLEALGPADPGLGGAVARLQGPDERLHAVVESGRELARRGDATGARRLFERARGFELKDLLQGFDGLLRDVRGRGRQMVVILRGAQENLAVAVDHIDSVASVDADQILPRPLHGLESGERSADLLVSSIVRRHDQTDLIQILDVERLFRSAGVGSLDPALESTLPESTGAMGSAASLA
jgi:purine-binding chemotaxis protein CheW